MHAGGRFATARGIDDAERLVLDDDTLLALLESPAAAVAPHGCFGWTGISFLVRRAELVSEYRRTGVPRRLPLASWEGGRAGSWLAAGNRLGTYWKRGIGQLRLPHQVP